jgi:pimeloyl-ACP methyl ester carboxylesterase
MTTATSGDQRATPPERGTTASRDLSDDAIGALDGYGIEECHLVGVSFGGYLAQLVALKHPSRMLTLTLIGRSRPCWQIPTCPRSTTSCIGRIGPSSSTPSTSTRRHSDQSSRFVVARDAGTFEVVALIRSIHAMARKPVG